MTKAYKNEEVEECKRSDRPWRWRDQTKTQKKIGFCLRGFLATNGSTRVSDYECTETGKFLKQIHIDWVCKQFSFDWRCASQLVGMRKQCKGTSEVWRLPLVNEWRAPPCGVVVGSWLVGVVCMMATESLTGRGRTVINS